MFLQETAESRAVHLQIAVHIKEIIKSIIRAILPKEGKTKKENQEKRKRQLKL